MDKLIERAVILHGGNKEHLQSQIAAMSWSFPAPVWLRAIDGARVPTPRDWPYNSDQWGKRQSHIRALENAIQDDVGSVLVVDATAEIRDDFAERIAAFLQIAPDDWDQLIFAGELAPTEVKPGVCAVSGCKQMSAYLVRGDFLKHLFAKWASGAWHIDYNLAAFQRGWKVYAPSDFQEVTPLCLQVPTPAPAVYWLIGPRPLLEYARKVGYHGGRFSADNGADKGVEEIMKSGDTDARKADRLRNRIAMIDWEASSFTPIHATLLWHPELTLELATAAAGNRLIILRAVTKEELFEWPAQHPEPKPSAAGGDVLRQLSALATKGDAILNFGSSSVVRKPTVFYHVAAMNHWREIVTEQLDSFSEAGLNTLKITYVGDLNGIPWLSEQMEVRGMTMEVLRFDAQILHYETFAMLAIEEWAKEDDGPVLYCHTKGASAPGDKGKRLWRHLMHKELISQWRAHIAKLDSYDAIGVNWRGGATPHFCGNFWLTTGKYIRRLAPFVEFHHSQRLERTSCEFWIGTGGARPLSLYCRDEDFCAPNFPFPEA